VEKLTPERRARPGDEQHARRLCRACYTAAVKTEQMAVVPLPGMIDISRFNRVTYEIGRCSVCGMERAAWIDPATSVLLCEHCFGRELRTQPGTARQGV
jgi:ribosomal protein S14